MNGIVRYTNRIKYRRSSLWRNVNQHYCQGYKAERSRFLKELKEKHHLEKFAKELPEESKRALIFELLTTETENGEKVIDSDEIFRFIDKNDDGVLNKEEFSHYVNSRSWFRTGENESGSHFENNDKPQPITSKQTFAVCIQTAVPFIGFGFVDNVIMIVAGNTIETSIGVTLGLSTLAAAGLGNLLSDVAGIGLGNTIEAGAHKLGLPDPKLTRAQTTLSRIRWLRSISSAIGIAIGCLLGMCPLLFVESTSEKRLKRIFDTIDKNGNGEIDFEELYEAMQHLGIPVKKKKLHKFFEFIDLDNDGVINFSEFCYLVEHVNAKFDPKTNLVHFKDD